MRTAQVFSFVRRRTTPDWSAQDIAEFYRVEAILVQSGLRVTSTRGLTDEGDPWFVFCRADDDEVIIHFARIDGRYVISSPAYCGNAAGPDFSALVRAVIERHPVLRPKPSGENLFLHPAALLVMLVASAFLKTGHAAQAREGSHAAPAHGTSTAADAAADPRTRGTFAAGGAPMSAAVTLDATQETLLLSAINAAIVVAVPEHALAMVPLPALPAPDAGESPQMPATSAMVLDRPHDQQVMGSGAMTPVGSSPAVNLASIEPPAVAPAHTAPANDTLTIHVGSPEPVHYQLDAANPPVPAATSPAAAAPEPISSVQHVSLSGLTDIPQADKVILQGLGVPEVVAYTAVAPAAFSAVIHDGVHTETIATHAAAPPPAAASATPTAPAPIDTVNTPPASAPAAVHTIGPTPDIAAVMAIVQQFQALEAQPTVLLSDHGAIFYDAAAVNAQYSAVKSVTYDFGDGFTISLVGLPVELTHAGAHV